ncbi:MAG: dinitrogenase iron-molybdenum cofactor biosynthesis protein [bacterium]|nr:dinitrogenase iron-molybdenum cofactor biosynthesis protein [bacterium]
MRVAIPVWGSRVSPVFDAAGLLLVVDYAGDREVKRHLVELPTGPLSGLVNTVLASRTEELLCGAISRPLLDMLQGEGISVTPFLAGEVECLLEARLGGRLADPCYLMPGCCRGRRHRQRGRGGHHRTAGRKEP